MKKQKTLLVLFFAVMAFKFMGCNQMGSSSAENAPNSNNSQSTDLTALTTPEGHYLEKQQLPNDYTGHLQVGCLTPGHSGSKLQIDSRLNVGMHYEIKFRSQQQSSPLVLGQADAYVALTSKSVVALAGEVTSLQNLGGLSLGLKVTRTCATDTGSDSFTCLYAPMPTLTFPQGAYAACDKANAVRTNWTISSGEFTTLTGQLIPAYKIEVSFTGNIICDGRDLGPGQIKELFIVSNNVPADDSARFCGGVSVFSSYSYFDGNNRNILVSSIEKTRVPVVQ